MAGKEDDYSVSDTICCVSVLINQSIGLSVSKSPNQVSQFNNYHKAAWWCCG